MFSKNAPTRKKGNQLLKLLNKCLERDEFKCQACYRPALELHHIVYKSQGGDDCQNNLISLCIFCHKQAHQTKNKSIEPFLKDYHKKYIAEKNKQNEIREVAL